jgi:hypothetical protein
MLDTVPLEILECVAKYLANYNDRLSLSLSCKDFYDKKNLLLKPRSEYIRMRNAYYALEHIIHDLIEWNKYRIEFVICSLETKNLDYFLGYKYPCSDERLESALNVKKIELRKILDAETRLSESMRTKVYKFLDRI